MLLACAVGIVMVTDDSSATSTFSLSPVDGKDYGKVSTSISYVFNYELESNSATYKAVLEDTDGNVQSGAVTSNAEGTIYNTSTVKTIKITLPSTAGDYVLRVTVTEGEGDNATVYERTAYVRSVEAIKLTAELENVSSVSRSFVAYFYIQQDDGSWEKVGDKQTIDVSAHGTYTASMDYVVRDVENATFCLQSEDDAAIGGAIVGLGPDYAHTYYTEANDYKVLEYICIGILVVLLIVAIWIYRKPIRNFGKPKGRR